VWSIFTDFFILELCKYRHVHVYIICMSGFILFYGIDQPNIVLDRGQWFIIIPLCFFFAIKRNFPIFDLKAEETKRNRFQIKGHIYLNVEQEFRQDFQFGVV